MSSVLQREQKIAKPRSEVFRFFADPANLEALTPGFLGFRMLTPPPIKMGKGALIDYEIKLFRVKLRWKTLIEAYEPDSHFIDVQLEGPYRTWVHRHDFLEVPGGTLVRDTVTYDVPLGPLGIVARHLFVARTLDHIFDYRQNALATHFRSTARVEKPGTGTFRAERGARTEPKT